MITDCSHFHFMYLLLAGYEMLPYRNQINFINFDQKVCRRVVQYAASGNSA